MYVWLGHFVYSKNWHDIVNQLYFNKKKIDSSLIIIFGILETINYN